MPLVYALASSARPALVAPHACSLHRVAASLRYVTLIRTRPISGMFAKNVPFPYEKSLGLTLARTPRIVDSLRRCWDALTSSGHGPELSGCSRVPTEEYINLRCALHGTVSVANLSAKLLSYETNSAVISEAFLYFKCLRPSPWLPEPNKFTRSSRRHQSRTEGPTEARRPTPRAQIRTTSPRRLAARRPVVSYFSWALAEGLHCYGCTSRFHAPGVVLHPPGLCMERL